MTKKRKMPSFMGTLIAVVLLFIVLAIATPDTFLTVTNIMNILKQSAIYECIALGMTLVLLTGGIDISVGPMVALSSCIMGVLLVNGVENAAVLIIVCIVVGIGCGLMNGLIFTKLKLPHPFVSTMGSRQVFRGLALLITGSAPIGGFSAAVKFAGAANIGDVFPVCFIIIIALCVILHIFLTRTVLGRNIYSVGGNKDAARLSGINVPKTLTFVYMMSGLMCSIAAVISIGRVGTATPLAGETYDMDAIASCVIGGASFNGGKGTVGGTFLGAMCITIIRNGLNLLGAQTDVQYIVIGLVIIAAVFVDVVRGRSEEKNRMKARAVAQGEA